MQCVSHRATRAAGGSRRYNRGYTVDMKTAISIPDPVFRSAEQLAARLGLSRSELYCRALKDMLARHDQAMITAQLNEIYEPPTNNSGLDPVLALLQASSIREKDAW